MKTKTRADRRSCPNPKTTTRELERAVLAGIARALRHIDTQVNR